MRAARRGSWSSVAIVEGGTTHAHLEPWGIVVLGFIGLGIALGVGLGTLTGPTQDGPQRGLVVGIGWVLSGGLLRVVDRQVMGRHLDQPQPQFVREPMPEPVIRERGNLQAHRLVPQLDLETSRPRDR